MRDLPWHLLLNLGQEPAGVQARGLFGPVKVHHLAMQALKVLQATRAGFFSEVNHCLCSHFIAVVLSVTHLNETSTRRYILSKQARFQLGPSEYHDVVAEQLAKLPWRLVSHEILRLPLASCWEKGDQCYRVLCHHTGQTLLVI